MKIMLVAVNAKYIHSNLAIYSLYSYVREYQKDIILGEYTINQRNDEILKAIYRERPDILGFSCYIWNVSQILEIADAIHKVLPQTKVWLGGPEVSYDATKVMEDNDFITGIMRGEGEQTFAELMKHYLEKTNDISVIKGITWRSEENKVIENEARARIELDTIPFVHEKLPANRIVYYESSRGCPFSCSYCLSSVDKQLRFRDTERVKRELQYFLDKRVPQVKFVDRTFNCKAEHALEIWTYLKEHDNGITNFHFEIAADLLSDGEVTLLNSLRAGQVQLEIGVQSTNPRTLKAINRVMNFDKVAKRVGEVARKKNIHQHLDLIAGLPYEDLNSFQASFNAVYDLEPQQLQLGFLKVLKGSKMADEAATYECECQIQAPYEVLQTKWLSFADVLVLKQVEEMVEVYYNKAQFEKTIRQATKLFSTPFEFYQKLGAFYEVKQYDKKAHSRIRRYDILLEFLSGIKEIDLAYYKELMVFDLYAREKLKTRPTWASEAIKDKRQRDKDVHLERFHYAVDGEGEVLCEPMTILFNYQKRDVLTNNATWQKEVE